MSAVRAPAAARPPTVGCEIANGVARVTLDRPPLNVVDLAMLEELAVTLGMVRALPDVRCVLLAGAGKAFCAGVDVADHTADRVHEMLTRFHDVVRTLLALPMPVVCAVHGAALGGGLELALACDIVLATEEAKLGQPEIRLGVFPPVAAVLLPNLVGRQRALDLILSGQPVSGVEARAMGLVAGVFPAGAFAAGVQDYVTRLASLSAPVLQLAKRAVTDGFAMSADAALVNAERLYLRDLMQLADPQEGLAAWLEKRAPAWRHA